MRVLHLSSLYAPHFYGGAERVVQVLAEGTAELGIETAVACLVPERKPRSELNGVQVFPLEHGNPIWMEDVAKYPGVLRKLSKTATLFNFLTEHDFARLVKEYKPDVVHTHSMVSLPPGMWKVAKDHGAMTVHTLHDYDLLCIRAALFKDGKNCDKQHLACSLFSKVKRRYHGHIDHVVGVSESILQCHLDHGFFGDLPSTNRHIIWNPVQRTPVVDKPRHTGPFRFGFIGRLVPEKGVDCLIEACALLGGDGWQLDIAGRAPDGVAALRQAAVGLPIEFVGFVDSKEFFSRIDVLVVPSIWAEPFGLTVIEAYGAGVPVIGSDIAGTGEIIGACKPSWLVAPGEAVALAEKMREVLEAGRSSLETFSGPPAVLARTEPRRVIEQYVDVYRLAPT